MSRLEEAHAFYVGLLGFELMQRYGPSALFVAAGGYHHHIGLNTWAGVGAPPPPPGALGLKHFEVLVPTAAALDQIAVRLRGAGVATEPLDGGVLVRDPAENAILLRGVLRHLRQSVTNSRRQNASFTLCEPLYSGWGNA